MFRTVSQKNFIRGVNAAQNRLDQLPGTIPRISNLIYTSRGALKTCDGTSIVAQETALSPAPGPITELAAYLPTGVVPYYLLLRKSASKQLAAPTNLAVADGGAGALAAGTYFWKVTALDGAGGETTASNEVTITLAASHQANLTWTAVTNAAGGYNVYRTVSGGAAGSESLLIASGVTGTSYTDNTPDANAIYTGVTVPTSNSTQTHTLHKVFNAAAATLPPVLNFDDSASSLIATFPADYLPILPVTEVGIFGFGSPSGGGSGIPNGFVGTPSGGLAGNTSPIPQMVPFINSIILCLGNGFAPRQFTNPSTLAALTNSFTASWPAWTASTVYAQGSQIASGGHVFKATQGGTSGAGTPTFPAALGATVADNNVIWQNAGTSAAVVVPGAAHGIVHAGALWLFNTSPTNTADGLHGPTALVMSDINNPNSWNPVNAAFIGKDDGTEGMGLASFTIAEAGIPPTGSLVCFKEFSTYQINGVFGAANFSIQITQSDLGCSAPRTIQFLPGFGIARLTHMGVALFDGVRDRIISEEIRPYLFGGESDIVSLDWNIAWFSKACQVAVPPMYVMAIPLTSGAGKLATLNGVTAGSNP